MYIFSKNIIVVACFILFIMTRCNSPQPIYSLDTVPFIPLPLEIKPSDEVLAIDAIKFIRVKGEDKNLSSMAQDLNTFWKKHTQQELLFLNDLADYDGTITLIVDSDFDTLDEAYELEIESNKISIKAESAIGVFRGIKTLEQIIVLSQLAQGSDFLSLPGGEINDHPSYEYRGAMLDVSRHFFSVTDVKRYIDLLSIYKINFLHFHLSDDQGWRIEIKSRPKLTEIGGQTEVGGGEGGFYTQEEFKEIIEYAAERFINIVPEIDLPGHTNAALASYANLNCNGKATELYTGIKVGFSTLCVDKEETYEFVDDVIREISEMTPGPYFHIGGDESHVTPVEDFNRFMDRTLQIVKKYNKIPMGWYELITADIPEETLLQYWAKTEEFSKVISKKSKILISASSFSYLDMKYDIDTPLGLFWAGYLPVKKAYDWDPRTLVPKFDPGQIVGLEAPLWSETIENFDGITYMAFPRIIGHAEIGWTEARKRKWDEYAQRLSFHGPLLEALDVKYYRSEEIKWK